MFDFGLVQKRLRETHINHPIIDPIERDIISHAKNGFRSEGGMAFVLKGETGSGKSRLVERVMAAFNDVDQTPVLEPGKVLVKTLRALYCRVPTDATTRAAAKKLVEALGIPAPARLGAEDLARLIRAWAPRRKLELAFFDELHHFVQKVDNRPIVITNAANWLKLFLDELNVPAVFIGTSDLDPLLDHDEGQLRTRVSRVKEILPFDFDDDQQRDDYRTVLYSFEREIGLPQASNLADLDLAERIYIASAGYVGRIFKLLHTAIEVAAGNGEMSLNRTNLSVAFHEGASAEQQKKNPFLMDDVSELRKKMPKVVSRFQAVASGGRKPKMSANDIIAFGH
jgi:hypothetical protein